MAAPARWLPALDRRSVLVLVIALGALLAPWPGLGRVFGGAFSVYANGVTRALALSGDAYPRFSLPPRGRATVEDGGDWAVRLSSRDDDADDAGMLLDTRILGYTPLAVLAALAVASSLARRRRLTVLAFALACVLAREAVAIALPVARAFGGDGARKGWAFGPLAEIVWYAVITPPAMSYATPLLAWWTGFALTTPREAPPGPARRAKAHRVKRGRRQK